MLIILLEYHIPSCHNIKIDIPQKDRKRVKINRKFNIFNEKNGCWVQNTKIKDSLDYLEDKERETSSKIGISKKVLEKQNKTSKSKVIYNFDVNIRKSMRILINYLNQYKLTKTLILTMTFIKSLKIVHNINHLKI